MNLYQFLYYLKITIVFILFLTNCYTSKDTSDLPSILPLLMNQKIALLMIGDSLSERSNTFDLQQKLGDSYKINDISVSGRDVRIWLADKQKIQANKANIVIVNLGTNDASYYSTNEYPKYYSELIDYLRSIYSWKIVLTLVPPTNDPILKERIQINNLWIQTNYPTETKVDLLDLFEKNKSLPLYPTIDSIHPNPIGYDIIGSEYSRILSGLRI